MGGANGVYSAQTGGVFTVYDTIDDAQCTRDFTDFCYPVAQRFRSETAANLYGCQHIHAVATRRVHSPHKQPTALSRPGLLILAIPPTSACTADLYQLHPNLLSPRNLFRLPGLWDLRCRGSKSDLHWENAWTRVPRGSLNIFNHSNSVRNRGVECCKFDP